MYFFKKNSTMGPTLEQTFQFAGIGLEYRKDKSIVGLSRKKLLP
ncbi:NADH:ubiquinone oxidoreductase (plasmid) [Acetobacter orientalis]|uniref:NADH:ubiquinone oxidoreductase n=1 Tax=Acetobacter orientalis TaxID=146474 RepID=A0A2Z5ZMZ4_9PROT|nr:NADH:ubiquinone oxidoreductase [Acetobacter orientalis]